MQNFALQNLGQSSVKLIIRRLTNQTRFIFGEYNDVDYQNLMDGFARLTRDIQLFSQADIDNLIEFIDDGIVAIAQRYEAGLEIHPGIINILIRAIQVLNQTAAAVPYMFPVGLIANARIGPDTHQFMIQIVQPMTQNLQLLALHHAPWVNPAHVAREDVARAEAPGAETCIARTLAEFEAMNEGREARCLFCLEEFIERPEDAIKSKRMSSRHPVFMPVVFHKDVKGKWFHPMHAKCANDMKKNECPMCRVPVVWPKMLVARKTRRRPHSSPTRSLRRSSKKNFRRSSNRRSPGRSLKRRSADF